MKRKLTKAAAARRTKSSVNGSQCQNPFFWSLSKRRHASRKADRVEAAFAHMPMKHRLHFHDGQNHRGAAVARLGEIGYRVRSALAQITLRDIGTVEIDDQRSRSSEISRPLSESTTAAWSGLVRKRAPGQMGCSGRLENGDNLTPVSDHDRLAHCTRTYRPVWVCNSRIVIVFTVCPMCQVNHFRVNCPCQKPSNSL